MASPKVVRSDEVAGKSHKTSRVITRASSHANDTKSSMALFDLLLSALLPALVLLHLIIAPYTKVEESFNIQATHDVLVYGTPTSNIYNKLSNTYDHFTFPGAVPRTFLGPVLLAGFAQPIVAFLGFQHAQVIVRALLGLFNALCLVVFARNLRRAYGAATARWYLLLQASQFHIIFYASRPLPNMFAFGLTTLAFAFLLSQPANLKSTPRRQRLSITMFVFAAVIFRSEIALLLATNILYLLLLPAISLEQVIFPFSASFFSALLTSVPIDSYFWQRPLWPELWGFYYNVVQGSSSNWGTSPWYYYFASALPRLLVNPLTYTILIPYAWIHPALSRPTKRLVVPSLLFVAIYSLQPHKEARFIFYVVPPLTAAAALGANLLFNRRSKNLFSSLLALALVASVILSFAASTGMLLLSSLNYPGGEALAYIRDTALKLEASDVNYSSAVIPVHADVLSCMTGVTLFGSATGHSLPNLTPEGLVATQQFGGVPKGVSIAVDKTEDKDELGSPEFWQRFSYVLTETPEKVKQYNNKGEKWETVAVFKGYGGIEIVKPGGDKQDGLGLVMGSGKTVALWKHRIREMAGGWWIGPRMVDRITVLQRVRATRWDETDA